MNPSERFNHSGFGCWINGSTGRVFRLCAGVTFLTVGIVFVDRPLGLAALAWLLHQGNSILPIPGTRTPDHLRAWAMAPEIDLTDDDREEIDRLLPIGWAWGDRYDDQQAQTVERYS